MAFSSTCDFVGYKIYIDTHILNNPKLSSIGVGDKRDVGTLSRLKPCFFTVRRVQNYRVKWKLWYGAESKTCDFVGYKIYIDTHILNNPKLSLIGVGDKRDVGTLSRLKPCFFTVRRVQNYRVKWKLWYSAESKF